MTACQSLPYSGGMDVKPIKPERKAQLEEYAMSATARTRPLCSTRPLAEYLEWEQRDLQEAVEGIREGYEDVKAGRTQSADEVFEELRIQHGLPR